MGCRLLSEILRGLPQLQRLNLASNFGLILHASQTQSDFKKNSKHSRIYNDMDAQFRAGVSRFK